MNTLKLLLLLFLFRAYFHHVASQGDGKDNIVTSSNEKRIEEIERILEAFPQHEREKVELFSEFIDEMKLLSKSLVRLLLTFFPYYIINFLFTHWLKLTKS